MTLYKKKFRAETTRLEDRNYGRPGKYFVTICTKKKLQWFGEIKNKKMELNEIGGIVVDEWLKTPQIRQNVDLDEWCVMPDHFHGILIIRSRVETPRRGVSTTASKNDDQSLPGNVSTTASKNKDSHWKPNILGSILNQFKGAATKRIKLAGYPDFQWQSRFHDRVIRSDGELSAIRKYIRSNPSSWDKETIPWHADAAFFNL